MDFFTTRYIWWAVLLGAISAPVSLPLGSALGLLLELSCFPLLKDISPEHINSLLSVIHPVKFVAGDIIAKQGVEGTELIPDAIHLGYANAVGLSTLAGFLAAILFKLLG